MENLSKKLLGKVIEWTKKSQFWLFDNLFQVSNKSSNQNFKIWGRAKSFQLTKKERKPSVLKFLHSSNSHQLTLFGFIRVLSSLRIKSSN